MKKKKPIKRLPKVFVNSKSTYYFVSFDVLRASSDMKRMDVIFTGYSSIVFFDGIFNASQLSTHIKTGMGEKIDQNDSIKINHTMQICRKSFETFTKRKTDE